MKRQYLHNRGMELREGWGRRVDKDRYQGRHITWRKFKPPDYTFRVGCIHIMVRSHTYYFQIGSGEQKAHPKNWCFFYQFEEKKLTLTNYTYYELPLDCSYLSLNLIQKKNEQLRL